MIKLKTLLVESLFNVEDYRPALDDYISNMFQKEYDERQLLMFGITIEELKNRFLDNILRIPVKHEESEGNPYGSYHAEEDQPYGIYNAKRDQISVGFDLRKYYRYPRYQQYVDSTLFHEFIHAINFRKKLWDKVSYEWWGMDNKYYGDPEEQRAYGGEIKYYMVRYLGFSRREAEKLMDKYTTDVGSKSRKEWMPKYYDLMKEKRNDLLAEGARIDFINHRIQALEAEWERLDSQGTGFNRQREIEKELEKLRREKDQWENLYKTVEDSPNSGLARISRPSSLPESNNSVNPDYSTEYLGDCVELISQFNEESEAAQWIQSTLGNDENVYRISEKDFYRFVNRNNIPAEARNGSDREFYYIMDGRGHPAGWTNFVLYSINPRGDDIHYFFKIYPDPESLIVKLQKLPNGFGAGDKM